MTWMVFKSIEDIIHSHKLKIKSQTRATTSIEHSYAYNARRQK